MRNYKDVRGEPVALFLDTVSNKIKGRIEDYNEEYIVFKAIPGTELNQFLYLEWDYNTENENPIYFSAGIYTPDMRDFYYLPEVIPGWGVPQNYAEDFSKMDILLDYTTEYGTLSFPTPYADFCESLPENQYEEYLTRFFAIET